MSQSGLFEIGAVMDRLRPLMRLQRKRTPSDFAAALPEFMALKPYAGAGGAGRLFEDIAAALDALPHDPKLNVQHRTWGRQILGLDEPTENLTSRRRDLASTNGSATKNRDRFVIGSVLHILELGASEAPPASSRYDSGFEVLTIAVEMHAYVREPSVLRHRVKLTVQATRPGQRIVPLCYGGSGPFVAVVAHSRNSQKIGVAHIGTSALITGNPDFPTHLFWLSAPPAPLSKLSIQVVFEERFAEHWGEARGRLQVITTGVPKVTMSAAPRKAFERVIGLRIEPNNRAIVRFDKAVQSEKGPLQYQPRHASEPTAVELRGTLSAKHLDKRRESVTR